MKEHKMHKASRQLSLEDTMALLPKGDHGTLSVNGDDGYPYAVPVNYILLNGKIYLHSANVGYKIECLERDPKICFSAIISSRIIPEKITAAFESVVLTGEAVFVTDPKERMDVLHGFVDQKCAGFEDVGQKLIDKVEHRTAILRLEPTVEITGKAYRG